MMENQNGIIIGMGEALWDILPEGKKLGGAPANFAYHMSQFGYDSLAVSAIGEDKLGEEIQDLKLKQAEMQKYNNRNKKFIRSNQQQNIAQTSGNH